MVRKNAGTRISGFTVAIVGGGFAGAALAAQLLRKPMGAASVILIEKGARVGRGVAYGTSCGEHLLNVPARSMSIFPDDPEHFLRWAQINRGIGVKPCDYLPREVYGQYVASVLQHEMDLHPGRFQRVQDEAVNVTRVDGAAEIHLRCGQIVFADKVVLALGNFPPGDPRLPGKTPHSQRYVSDPWAPGALDHSDGNDNKNNKSDQHDRNKDGSSVLLVGSGLTSVDVAISLRSRGFRGTIHLLSRRGLLPQSHKACAVWPPFWDEHSPKTASGLLRLVRTQVEAAEAQGSGWRAVIDSLRSFTPAIWRSLSRKEQRKFLRHVRPYWEVHRHRVATEIGVTLASQIQSGQIKIHAGWIAKYEEDADGVDVTFLNRKTATLERLRVMRVINCTGPEVDCRRIENLLLNNLLRQKLVRPDPLFLGLDTSEHGALIDAQGQPSDVLYTIGPSRKGSLWETTAVPEIRVQASEMSTLLISSYEHEEVRPVQYQPSADVHSAA
jgi:uncharacterized NAD(P)/FAD-binding protein YdhS